MTINWREYLRKYPHVVDVALVALLFLAASGPAMLNSELSATDKLSWRSAVPLALIGSLAVLWRRGHPRTVVVVTALCGCAAGGFGYLITPQTLAPLMVALYELALRAPGRTTRWYWLGVTLAIGASALVGDRHRYPWVFVIVNAVLYLVLPVAVAEATRLRRNYLAAVQARAEHAEQTREEDARHRVAEERVRIARELHDVVAHHLALANAQAGTAAYLARSHPDQVEPILEQLTGTTTAALRELKATVGLLRRPDDTTSPLEPAPGLARLPELTAAFAASGLEVEVTVEGQQQPLSAGVDLTAFRIIQEALSNVTKHATTDTAQVQLTYRNDHLTITISNTDSPTDASTLDHPARGEVTAGHSAPGGVAGRAVRGGAAAERVAAGGVEGGFGLVGMRERVVAVGGRFHAGRRAEGGFVVTTTLPVR
ncbi:histidine kinase [Kribbella koreensis]|uniref:histidine kinase n=1 Tax=Kribbella koreensis TaxID=57909 RepID=A0ABP4BHL8_9ACTN